jgi:hypothetical protein
LLESGVIPRMCTLVRQAMHSSCGIGIHY